MNKPTHFDGCAGIAGFSIAAHYAGFDTRGFCEIDPFCQEIIGKRFPGRPIFADIRSVNRQSLFDCGIDGVDLQTWGFPCQPFSLNGERMGSEDVRYLWPEVLRVIADTRPSWVCCENVAGLISLGLDVVLSDLETIGYASTTFNIPACAAEAPHVRERIWIVSNDARSDRGARSMLGPGDERRTQEPIRGLFSPSVVTGRQPNNSWPERRSDVCGMAYGLSRGVERSSERLHALGNAIVPAVAYPILAAIYADLTATP